MTDTMIDTGAARAVDAVKTYGKGEAAVHALAGVTVTFPRRSTRLEVLDAINAT